MMKVKWMAVLALACLVVVGGCGKSGSQAPAGDEGVKSAETPASTNEGSTESAPSKVADQAAVSTNAGAIVITGSGNGQAGPITLDQPYYIIKAKYAADEYSILQVSYKDMRGGTEVEDSVAFVPSGTEYVRVFQPVKGDKPSVDITFDIQSAGAYTIEFQNPPALDAAQPAPLTVTGGKGFTITPLVKTAGDYVMLRLKYTGQVDPSKVGGIPLATGDLFDAVTGDPWVRNQSVYDHNIQSQDGATRPAPGVYFAIIKCNKDGGAWEATITESSSD